MKRFSLDMIGAFTCMLLWNGIRLTFSKCFCQSRFSRGSTIVSTILQVYENRVIAAAFLAVGYTVPNPKFDYEDVMALSKKKLGYEALGYWEFFSSEGADKIIEENVRCL
jgi:hypothetical protein